jgi:uncharacterized cupredoxin-like copper-binding protein
MKKLFLLAAAALFLLAACFHESAPVAPPTPAESMPTPAPAPTPILPLPAPEPLISIEAGNIFFNPKSLTVKVNQPITVNFTNKGSHTFTVDELGVNFPLRDASGSFTFTPTKTGSFTFYCSVPGHRQAGQFGTITVTE